MGQHTSPAELSALVGGTAPARIASGAGESARADVRVPGLEILDELGRGANTVVYRVRRQGVDYALKLLQSSVFVDSAGHVAFRREAALLTCVTHPGVARIHEVGQAHGRPYLVMELVDGRTLADELHAAQPDEARVLAIAADVADALAAAHRAGLAHRDVKPQNIMIQPDGRAKVIDFGLAARTAGGDSGGDTAAGTFAYAAPEQTGMLNRLVDGRSDLYSLGVVLFHCVTGSLPFTSTDVGELLRLHAVAPPPDVRTLRPDLSPAFAGIIAKLLAKDPDDRYQTGEGLVADLRAVAAGATELAVLGADDTTTGGPLDGPLVGRERELGELTARSARALGGTGGIAMISGAPGGGKSRLVRELMTSVAAAGHLVLRGKSSADDVVPLGAIRSAVEQYVRGLDRLPPAKRAEALDLVRRAAGPGAALLRALSPALAALFPGPELADEDRQEQFAVAVAAFLTGLARCAGGGILHLDDVQWLDLGTRRVLHHLTADLADTPMLVIVTARDDPDSRSACEAFRAEFADLIDTQLELPPLDDAAMNRLVAAHLGGAVTTPELTAQLVARAGGNPFAVDEYVRAVVDAGLVRPSWGTWILEEGGLDALELPHDVLDLILARVTGLGAGIRRLLVVAAATGTRFCAADLAHICEVDEREVHETMRVAVDRRLVAGGDGGRYTFLHDRIREALLADLDETATRQLHLQIARALDAFPSDDAEHVYAVARHYRLSDIAEAPEQAFRACVAAGHLALADHAPQEALTFLEAAAAASTAGGMVAGNGFHEAYGIACLRAGQFVQARVHFEAALAEETVPTRRAMLLGMVCEAHHSAWQITASIAAARRALAEIGRPLPTNSVMLLLSTIWLVLASFAVSWTGIGRGTARGLQRERFRIEASVLAIASQGAATGRRMLLTGCLTFRQMYPANRIGPSAEYTRAHAHLAGVMSLAGLQRLSNRMFRRVSRIAEQLGDPRLVANAAWVGAIIKATARNTKVDVAALIRGLLIEHGRWLHAQEYLSAATVLCNQLTFFGHADEARAWHHRTRSQLVHVEQYGHYVGLVGAAIDASLGRADEAERQLSTVADLLADQPDNREQWVQYVMTSLNAAVELEQLSATFEATVAELDRWRITPRSTWPLQHYIWASIAYGRLGQCVRASKHEFPERLAAAERAVRELRSAATTPLLGVHLHIVRAFLAHLQGRHSRALRLLRRAERRAESLDAPVVGYQIARVRARVFPALGNTGEARRQARAAYNLALDYGWEHRARTVRNEFGVGDSSTAVRGSTGMAGTASAELHRRRLNALQQVSLAAATVLEPRELARVALDKTLGIFGADRAFLFLVDADTGELVPHLGRDAAGADLDVLTGYGASLVTRVLETAEPLVVTSAEDGVALGSQSALLHGLRSIMVAPLTLKGRVQGVVYLDSRVAKGIFTADDVDILVAITNHVAVALETARAAQLEVAVRAAREQRDLAESMSSAMAELSTTLVPIEVLERLLGVVARALPADAACLLSRVGDGAYVVGSHGDVPEGGAPDVAGLLGLRAPVLGRASDGQAPPLPGAASWVVVPLTSREESVGLLVVASQAPDAYTEAHLQIAAALAGQGMTAYENARLFDQVHELATTDPLTGVANRRHFFELAATAFGATRPAPLGLAAIMLDIDHFKRINDTYGHMVGDEVIREVARRLGLATRDGDLLARYGGEEFALMVTAHGDDAEHLAELLRAAVGGAPFHTAAGPLDVTVSVGIALLQPTDRDLGALLGRADAALYDAKEQGRDRIVAA